MRRFILPMKKFLLFLIYFLSASLRAHPHLWVDVFITPEIKNGQMTQLKMSWQLDPFYAELLLEEANRSENETEFKKHWAKLETDIQNNLAKEHFYFFTAEPFSGNSQLRLADGILFIDIQLTFEKALSKLYYQIYEPTYYVEIRHHEKQNLSNCELKITESNPPEDKVLLAYSLDREDISPIPDLGKYFAQEALLKCNH